jgi:hypothetical protein
MAAAGIKDVITPKMLRLRPSTMSLDENISDQRTVQ